MERLLSQTAPPPLHRVAAGILAATTGSGVLGLALVLVVYSAALPNALRGITVAGYLSLLLASLVVVALFVIILGCGTVCVSSRLGMAPAPHRVLILGFLTPCLVALVALARAVADRTAGLSDLLTSVYTPFHSHLQAQRVVSYFGWCLPALLSASAWSPGRRLTRRCSGLASLAAELHIVRRHYGASGRLGRT